MQEIYQAPATQDASIAQQKDFLQGKCKLWLWLKWISFGLLLMIPMTGILGTINGVVSAFVELSETGQADPAELAAKISVALLTTIWAIVFTLPVLIFWIVAIKRHKKWKKLSNQVPV